MSPGKTKVLVERVIADVRRNGDGALVRLTKKFDRVSLTAKTMLVRKRDIEAGYKRLNPEKRRALEACARRIHDFHWNESKALPRSWTVSHDGVRMGQIYSPIDSVGIYVPGGRFAYPSTILMTAIPAAVAGVRRRAVVTPPLRLTDEMLAAAKIAGVTELYRVGGPAAIAALALGTKTISSVDFIIGPGNALVTEAKRQLFGIIGIDLLAGPSELVVLADESANPAFVAADLAAQAEHDPDAAGYMVSTSKATIAAVRRLLPKALARQCTFTFRKSMSDAVETANAIAGEHVEIMVRRPQEILDKLKNGGAFFIGGWSPAVMGDYWAGPSHVLPTGRSGRFASGLSVMSFYKRSSLIDISAAAFKRGAGAARRVAEMEGLVYHAAALRTREKES